MAVLKPEKRDQMFMESVQFAKQEVEQRQKAPVIVKAEEIETQFKAHSHVYLVDPRLGFHNRTFRFWINRIPAQKTSLKFAGSLWMRISILLT